MTYKEAVDFVLSTFIPAIHTAFKVRWHDTFDKCEATTKEEYDQCNGSMYTYYTAIINGLSKIPETPKYCRSMETLESINDHSYIKKMYDDFVNSNNQFEWMIEFIPLR